MKKLLLAVIAIFSIMTVFAQSNYSGNRMTAKYLEAQLTLTVAKYKINGILNDTTNLNDSTKLVSAKAIYDWVSNRIAAIAGGPGGTVVSDFNGRTGPVVPQNSDYAAYYPTITRLLDSITAVKALISGYVVNETDPTVPANVKAITSTNIANWNTAFGWGNHAGLYAPLSGSANYIQNQTGSSQAAGFRINATGYAKVFGINYDDFSTAPLSTSTAHALWMGTTNNAFVQTREVVLQTGNQAILLLNPNGNAVSIGQQGGTQKRLTIDPVTGKVYTDGLSYSVNNSAGLFGMEMGKTGFLFGRSTVPPPAQIGASYYDSTSNQYKFYRNGAFKNVLLEGDAAAGGATNIGVTHSSTKVTLTSSTGTGSDINAVDNSTAGVATPAQKAQWDNAYNQSLQSIYIQIDKTIDSMGWRKNDSTLRIKSIGFTAGSTKVSVTLTKSDSTISAAFDINEGNLTIANLAGSVPASKMPALTGDVTTSAGAVATTIANSAVTNAKMANMAANTIKGNLTGSSAAPTDITKASLEAALTVGNLAGSVPASKMPALTGDVTTSAGAVATTIANSAVTNAKMANMSAYTVKMRKTNSTGAPEDATLTELATLLRDGLPVEIGVALSDETTAITTGTAKVTIRMPYNMQITAVRANVNTASSSGLVTVDIKENGTSIMTTTKLTIDASEKTSTTAATAAVVTDNTLADDNEITFDITTAGTGAKGLKIWIIGFRVTPQL